MNDTPAITAELLGRHDRPGPRYTSYPTAVEFSTAVGESEHARCLERSAARGDELSVYVHLPFCAARCLYCACHAIINPDHRAADPYLERLLRELELVCEHLGHGRRVTQLHLGGGTPTFYPPEQLDRLTRALERHFDLAPDAERAIELDPRATTPEHLDWLARAGFDRISVGVQDLDAEVQRAIHRVQPLALTRALVLRARALGIASVNVDLIYGLPHQTTASFRSTVEQVVDELRPQRLAVYAFAFVPWLKGHQKKLDVAAMPTAEARLELLVAASEVLVAAGYRHIGMDHFARPDDALCQARDAGRLSRNFMGYTTDRAPELIGLGTSAISYVADTFVQNLKHLGRYQRCIDAGHLPTERGHALSHDDLVRAWVIRELMCNLRVDKRETETRFALTRPFDEVFADARPTLEQLRRDGLLVEDEHELRATRLGHLFVRNIAMAFDRVARKCLHDEAERNPDRYLGATPRQRPVFSRTV